MAEDEQWSVLPGSERTVEPSHQLLGEADPDEQVRVTCYLRPRAPLPDPARGAGSLGGQRMGRGELARAHGASEQDLAALRDFAGGAGLAVEEEDPARRAVVLGGRLGDVARAFGTRLSTYRTPEGLQYRGRSGPLHLPRALAGRVTGVFGLDDRPQAAPHFRQVAAPSRSYSPPQVAEAYGFPSGVGAAGECIALIELGGGYRSDDVSTYFSGLSLPVPELVAVSVDGGGNQPGTPEGADGEVMLDIEVAGGVAPGVRLAAYFAPNTDQGFLDAVTTAVHDTANAPSVISISWGGPESTWTAQAMQEMDQAFAAAAALGVTVTVAAGDNGSTDGVQDGLQHVDFPASSPHALACGGTRLLLGPAGALESEVVWNDLPGGGATGGGVSAQFPLPSFQEGVGVPASVNPAHQAGRGVPDVAGVADPDTGYSVRVDGEDLVEGGTSAVAPLWAGVVATLNHALGEPAGLLQPFLYSRAAASGFYDVVSGDNPAYSAGPGWDACSGLGSPRVGDLIAAVRATGGTTGS